MSANTTTTTTTETIEDTLDTTSEVVGDAVGTATDAVGGTIDSISEVISNTIANLTGAESETIHLIINTLVMVFTIFLVLRLTEKIMLRNIKKSDKTKITEAKLKTITKMLDGFFKFITIFLVVIEVCVAFGMDKTQVIAISSGLTVALGFAAQDLVKDLINGVIIVIEDQYVLGDFCEINGLSGTVEKLTMRVTQLRDLDGALHIIPNGTISEVTTFSKEFITSIVVMSVAYHTDISWLIKLIEKDMQGFYEERQKSLLQVPSVLGISEFKDNSINIKIMCDTVVGERLPTEYALRLRLKELFDREGVEIPLPQRDVRIINK